MNIYILASSYPSKSAPKGTTPVVHYFAKEWVEKGNKVCVFHISSAFPKWYYFFGRFFKDFLDSRLGYLVPTDTPLEYEEEVDGVQIIHVNINKNKPHGRFSKNQLKKCFQRIESYIGANVEPDVFVGHWHNPQLDLLFRLKSRFCRPTCLVFHSNHFDELSTFYKSEFHNLTNCLDLIGFRNQTAQRNYELLYGKPNRSFIAASGVSKSFLDESVGSRKTFGKISNFVYVGFLIARKCPVEVVMSVCDSYLSEPFDLTFIGSGKEKQHIEEAFAAAETGGRLHLTGRITRDEVIGYLKQADVFVMISREEIFGLVYLEAMALGCITIAARNEGIDGIIRDGENGFLCEAGNSAELTVIINKIRNMTPEELSRISLNAQNTALSYSDKKVAERYLNELKEL